MLAYNPEYNATHTHTCHNWGNPPICVSWSDSKLALNRQCVRAVTIDTIMTSLRAKSETKPDAYIS